MDIASNSWGICITCMHRSYCLSFQNGIRAERPIWDCNEYGHNDTEVDVVPHAHNAQLPKDKDTLNEDIGDRAKGLCINCDNRDFCMQPMPIGGVWHCENYR